MATNKPTKPVSTLPTTFGGTKTAYTAERISSGYEANVEEIIDGGNLNYSLSGTFERLNYLTTIADVLNATPVGKTVVVDSNNRYDYITPADDTTVVHLAGTEIVTGNKTFSGTNTFSTSTGLQAKEPVMTPQNNDLEGGDIIFKGATNDPLVNYDFHVDRQDGKMRIWGYDSNGNTIVPFNVDMKNNRVYMSGYNAMPNYSAGVSLSTSAGSTYTTPNNGYIKYEIFIDIWDEFISNLIHLQSHNQATSYTNTVYIPVPKGFTHTISKNDAASSTITFYPCLGG